MTVAPETLEETAETPETPETVVAVARPPADVGGRLARALAPVVGLLAWLYLYLLVLLGAWLAIGMLATGWQPLVITSGSMQPTLRPGDVVLIAEPSGPVAQRTVITFEAAGDPNQRITHRVYEVGDGAYVTKGDANPTIDSERVPFESVEGVGRLVVPLVGLPMLWAQQGDSAALLSWAVVSLASLAVALSSAGSLWRRDRRDRSDRGSPVAGRAIRRVRVLIGALIGGQYLIDPSALEVNGARFGAIGLLVLSITVLVAINALSTLAGRSGDEASIRRASFWELVGDTALVVVLTTAAGTSGIGWVLFALPIIEAATRFRLAGALLHWMALTGLALATRIWVVTNNDTQGGGDLIGELEQMLDQLSVLLLVIIPGAYLVEQLTGDVAEQKRATAGALERGRLLQHVAETGHEINRLGVELFPTIVASIESLGFDEVDVWMARHNQDWKPLATSADSMVMAPPGYPGSGLRDADLLHREIAIDLDDPDPVDRAGLAATGLAALVRVTLSDRDGTVVVVRAGLREQPVVAAEIVEALRLLCSQATVALQNEQLLTQLQQVHDEMQHQANHDSLTRLPNRARFLARLDEALAKDRRPGCRHAVLFLDLDGFKPVNDRYGHEMGDRLLCAVADRLEATTGDGGFVARLGGDEFTVLLEDAPDQHTAEELAGRLHEVIARPFGIHGETIEIGCSVGIAYEEPDMAASELLRRSDVAMYAVKGARDETPHASYHRELDELDRRRERLTNDFRKALRSNELDVAYQPMVVSASGKVLGVEALLRWTNGEMGPISPPAMVSIAEVAGLVLELNRWILRRVARDAESWQLPPAADFFVAVNVSPTELASPFLLSNVLESFPEGPTDRPTLVIELSERIVSSDESYADNLNALAARGVHLALDDFGEGKTSLGHLRGLPISMLKLDRLLVQNAVLSRPDRIILESVTSLAHELGFLVVAEGVETAEHQAAVVECGADLIQGYLLHRPMTSEQCRVVLASVGVDTEASLPPVGSVDSVGVDGAAGASVDGSSSSVGSVR